MSYEAKSADGREATDSAHKTGASITPAATRATLPLRAGCLLLLPRQSARVCRQKAPHQFE